MSASRSHHRSSAAPEAHEPPSRPSVPLGSLSGRMPVPSYRPLTMGRAEALALMNAELEMRVSARTMELETANDQLMLTAQDLATTLTALAEANDRLEEEKAGRERVEGELRLAQRLEAVGQLAAGVAHEINTPIQYLSDSVHFLQGAFSDLLPVLARVVELPAVLERHGVLDEAAELRRVWNVADGEFVVEQIPGAIERSLDGISRVAAIVRAMKAFAHPGSESKAPANLNDALSSTVVVCRNEYKYVADVELDLGELPLVPCQLGELNQVFLNLVVNAAHAVGERVEGTEQRGTINIATYCHEQWAVIRISDTGSGIPAHLAQKIFDPFFTTKPVGKGTGQGLTMARSIVVKHGGTLTFESERGRGTIFEIRLPLEPAAGSASAP
ncbi:MAG: sensor protein [Labilithrix sp.]|nr:sensor protein [Labilithrix sp.]